MLNIEGALYFCTFFLGIVNSLIVQPVAAAERTVFYRERAAHMYSVLPYVLSLVRAWRLSRAVGSCDRLPAPVKELRCLRLRCRACSSPGASVGLPEP